MLELFGFFPIIIIVGVLLIFAIFFASRYKTSSPNKPLIISGNYLGKKNVYVDDGNKGKVKIITNGGAFVLPIFQQVHKNLSLSSSKLDISTPEVYTEKGVPIMVSATVVIKIGNSVEEIATAAEQYLGKKREEMEDDSTDVLEGHLRSILGSMTVEDIYKNRDTFAEKVQEQAAPDLEKMGLRIISFTIKDITDTNGYLESLGKPQIAEVRKNAEVAEAEANKESRIQRARAEQEAQNQEIQRKVEIAEATKEQEIKVAGYEQESQVAKAKAEQIAVVEQRQVEIIEQEKQLEIKTKQNLISEQDAENKKNIAQKQTDAQKYKEIAESEAEAKKIELIGEAEAEKIRKRGLAEAESKEKMADALSKLDEAGKIQAVLDILPELVKEAAAPIGNIDKIVSYGGNGTGTENSMTGMSMNVLAQTFDMLNEMTGIDMKDIIQRQKGNEPLQLAIEEQTDQVKQAKQTTNNSKKGIEVEDIR